MIKDTLVNTQTHRQLLTSYTSSSASWVKTAQLSHRLLLSNGVRKMFK